VLRLEDGRLVDEAAAPGAPSLSEASS